MRELQARTSFIYFCENILNLEMTSYHKEIAMAPLQNRYLCIVIPTGHSKTTLFSFAYPLWRLWKENEIEICLVSSSIDQSMKIFSKVQAELETNPFFARLLPTNRHESWNKSQVVLRNKSQYYIKPLNATARGIHPHYIIYDDIQRDPEGITAGTPLKQVKETFWSVFFPRGQIHNCQHIVVGTPLAVDDLYADLEKKKDWCVIRKPAVIEKDGEWVRALWPERFSLDALQQIRSGMTSYRFEREYMCRPRASGDTLYPKDMILNCLDENLEFGYDCKGVPFIGSDFAMSTKSSGDYNVFTVVDHVTEKPYIKKTDQGEIEIENPVFVRRIIRFRGNVGQVESITQLCDHFPNAKVIADNSGVGAKFVQELRENQITVDAQDFRPANRNMLLMNLRRLIEKNRLVIPSGPESSPFTNRLIAELGSFRSVRTKAGSETFQSDMDHDDMVISLALAVKDIVSPRKMLPDLFYGE